MISNFDRVIIRNIMVAFSVALKFYAAVHIALRTALCFLVDKGIQDLPKSIELDKFQEAFCEVAPMLRQRLFIVSSLNDTLGTVFKINGDCVVPGLQWIVHRIIRISLNCSKQHIGIQSIQQVFNTFLYVEFPRDRTASADVLDMLNDTARSIHH